jgi:hypothetical protein
VDMPGFLDFFPFLKNSNESTGAEGVCAVPSS